MSVVKELPESHFANVVRLVKQADIEKVKAIRNATYVTLRRLRKHRNMSKAVDGIPDGSNQSDPMSIMVWLDGIGKKDEAAIKQVVAIDATATKRVKG